MASENRRGSSLRLNLTSKNDHTINVEPQAYTPSDVMRETNEFVSLSDEVYTYIELDRRSKPQSSTQTLGRDGCPAEEESPELSSFALIIYGAC